MATLKRWVRIQPKQTAQSFYRCGMQFTRDWQPVEVDKATAERLEQEQMLEVTDTQPQQGATAVDPLVETGGEAVGALEVAGENSQPPTTIPHTVDEIETEKPVVAKTTGKAKK